MTERKQAEDAQRFLAQASDVLSSSLDYRTTLATVARLAVPALADWSAVDVLEDDGYVERLAVEHTDPEKVALAYELERRYPPDPDAPGGVPNVLRTGEPEMMAEIPQELVDQAARDEGHRELLRKLELRSYMVVPLIARGRTLGAISFVSAESGRRYRETDLRLAEELARRAALAVDNARLYEEAQREIAERKRAQEELRGSRDELEIILRGVADSIIAQDASGRVFYANETAARMSGYSSVREFVEAPAEEVMSRFELLDEEGRPFPLERLPGRRVLGGEAEVEEVLRSRVVATGEERWSVVRATPVFDEEGRVRMAVSILRDITEQRRAEQERARLAAIVESSEDAIISKTLEGVITSWNRAAQRIYGYVAEEVVGQPITILVPPERSDEIPKVLETVRRGKKVEHYETVRVTKDEVRRNISLTVSPIKDVHGQVVGASTIARDVTERKEAERRLLEAESRYRTLVEQIPAITYVQEPVESDNPKAVTYMSPQYEAMLGYPPEKEIIDEEHWLQVLHPEDRERVLAEEVRTDETGEPFKIEYRMIARDGRVVWVRDEATLVRDEEGRPLYWLGVQYDITERKRAEETLREVREAERARMARDLHDGVLQDLSYAAAALGLAILEVEDAGLREQMQGAIDAVRRSAQGLRGAVNDLRLEEEANRRFPELVEAVVERSRGMSLGCDIRLEVQDKFPPEPLGDVGVELSRVIQEALTNARRHSGARNVLVRLAVVGDALVTEVADDGRGCDPEAPPGTGLRGMRERAQRIGGNLQVESAPGEGTLVRVRLPMHSALGGTPRGETGAYGEGR
jgi:PAS domain S-box-containing protein